MTNNGVLQLWSGSLLAPNTQTDHRSTEEGKHKLKWSQNSSDVEHTWPTVSFPGPPRAIFVYGTRYTNCATNRRYLDYFLLFMSFYEFWSSKKITIRQTGPNYFNSLSLIFGFEVVFHLGAVATFWPMSACRNFTLAGPHVCFPIYQDLSGILWYEVIEVR